jgi:ABC transport system ATP-binding/permease protein
MSRPLLTLESIHLTFGGHPLLEGASLVVAERERLCLVGRNGSGKSTLLKIAAGLVTPDQGQRFAHPGVHIAYLPQEPDFGDFQTVSEYVEAGLSPLDDANRAIRLIDELGLTGTEQTSTLSGGEARRAALARILAQDPDVMLLDEPTNHLDLPAIEWLEARLKSSRAAFVMISHDRRFLENLSNNTAWVDRGRVRRLDEGFSGFEAWRDRVLDEEEADRHKLDRKIAREQQWMHGGVTGRRKRNVRRVAELHAMRQQRRDARAATGSVVLTASDATSVSGKLVFELVDAAKAYGDQVVVEKFSTRVARGDRLGIVGPNGAGKTTLLKMLTGVLPPDHGVAKIGTNLELLVIDQRRDELKDTWTLGEALTGGRGDQIHVNGQVRHVSSYMKDFLFTPDQARTPVRVLSGGERARLLLARALAKPSNVLVLDEPTNDLDLETLDLLQEMLASYEGTVLLVSHDRDFLDRCVASVIVAQGDGRWVEYAGGYSDIASQRGDTDAAPNKSKLSQTRESGAKTADTNGAATASQQPRRKLTFKEKHALETLPKTIEALNVRAAKLEQEIADPELYQRNRMRFQTATAELGDIRKRIGSAEDDWLALEILKGQLETN